MFTFFFFKEKLINNTKKVAKVLVFQSVARLLSNKNRYQLWTFLLCCILHSSYSMPITSFHSFIPISQTRKLKHLLKLLAKVIQIWSDRLEPKSKQPSSRDLIPKHYETAFPPLGTLLNAALTLRWPVGRPRSKARTMGWFLIRGLALKAPSYFLPLLLLLFPSVSGPVALWLSSSWNMSLL